MEIFESKFTNSQNVNVDFTIPAEDWEVIKESDSWKRIESFVDRAKRERANREIDGELRMSKFEELLAGIPQEIKTLEVDVEKKIFRLNGIDFAEGCDYFSVSCTGGEEFQIQMELNKKIVCVSYDFWNHKQVGEIKVKKKK